MKLLISSLLVATAAMLTAPGAWAADAPIIRDVYTCSFNDGKDMDDLMAARDYYLKQMEKAGLEASTAYVWTPFKASVGFDFLWANNHENIMAYAESTDAFNASADAAAAMERFESVATCTSSLSMRRQTFQAEGEMTPSSSGAVIHAFACNYRHGQGPEALEDLVNHVGRVVGSMGLKDGSSGYVSVPGAGAGPNMADVYFYNVSSSLTSWAKRNAALQADPGMPSLMRHLQTVMDCGGSLFNGQRVVPPM